MHCLVDIFLNYEEGNIRSSEICSFPFNIHLVYSDYRDTECVSNFPFAVLKLQNYSEG